MLGVQWFECICFQYAQLLLGVGKSTLTEFDEFGAFALSTKAASKRQLSTFEITDQRIELFDGAFKTGGLFGRFGHDERHWKNRQSGKFRRAVR